MKLNMNVGKRAGWEVRTLAIVLCVAVGIGVSSHVGLAQPLVVVVSSWDDLLDVAESLVLNRLAYLDDSGEPQPCGEANWEVSDDRLVYTLYLYGVCSASDIVSSFAYARRMGQISLPPMEVYKVDAYTVDVVLTTPEPYFLHLLSSIPIWPEGLELESADVRLLGCWEGPYVVGEFEPHEYVLLLRNDDYSSHPSDIYEIVIRVVPERMTQLIMLESGDADLLLDKRLTWQEVLQSGAAMDNVYDLAPASCLAIDFNLRTEPFNDVRVRRAIAHAIDSWEILEVVFLGIAEAHQCMLHPRYLWDVDLGTSPWYDPQMAIELLSEAGYGDGLEFSLLVPIWNEDLTHAAYIIQESLAQIGVIIDVVEVSLMGYLELTTSGAFDATLSLQPIGYPSADLSRFITGSPTNISGFSNPDFDAILDECRYMSASESYWMYEIVDEILSIELPSIPLLYPTQPLVVSGNVWLSEDATPLRIIVDHWTGEQIALDRPGAVACFGFGEAVTDPGIAHWVTFDGTSEGTPPEIVLLDSSDEQSTTFEIILHGMWVENIEVEGTTYQRITIPGLATTQDVGKPELPLVSELIGIITDTELAYVDEIQLLEPPLALEGYNVYPYQEDTKDCEGYNEPGPFQIDQEIYNSVDPYPDKDCDVSEIMKWLRLKIANTKVYTVKYRPASKILEVYRHLRITVRHTGDILSKALLPVKETAEEIFDGVVLNVKKLTHYLGVRVGVKYLILTANQYVTDIQPLAAWKRCKGLDVTIQEVPRTVANTTAAIKAFITAFYNASWTYDLYVVLVGDISDVKSGAYTSPIDGSSGTSDHEYECVDGTDSYPDLFLGRISADDSADVREIVRKILTYEQIPPGGNWTSNVLLVAHRQPGVPPTYINNMETVRTFVYRSPPTFMKAYGALFGGSPAAGNNWVETNIIPGMMSVGVGIVGYRGHGGSTMWDRWSDHLQPQRSWRITEVDELLNGNNTPIVLSICCSNSKISVEDCIGEEWMEATNKGAVAHYGATTLTWTIANNTLNIELYKAIYHHGIVTLGPALARAEAQILKSGGSPSCEEGNVNWYMILGDPEMMIRR